MSTRSRRKFTPEFEAEAVQMVGAADGNIARVARELGLYDSMFENWCARPGPRRTVPPPLMSERRSGTTPGAGPDPARSGHPGKSRCGAAPATATVAV
ncbi:MAG: transposase [Acidimicrobiales bacterium]